MKASVVRQKMEKNKKIDAKERKLRTYEAIVCEASIDKKTGKPQWDTQPIISTELSVVNKTTYWGIYKANCMLVRRFPISMSKCDVYNKLKEV